MGASERAVEIQVGTQGGTWKAYRTRDVVTGETYFEIRGPEGAWIEVPDAQFFELMQKLNGTFMYDVNPGEIASALIDDPNEVWTEINRPELLVAIIKTLKLSRSWS